MISTSSFSVVLTIEIHIQQPILINKNVDYDLPAIYDDLLSHDRSVKWMDTWLEGVQHNTGGRDRDDLASYVSANPKLWTGMYRQMDEKCCCSYPVFI